jgi:hypothetical protein
MGLDMFLYASKYLSSSVAVEKDIEAYNTVKDLIFAEELAKGPAYVRLEIAYWRKANAIHKFFVDLDSGTDECQDIYVEREQLAELLNRCNRILENKSVELANELLPPQSGFFFGSTEVDEYYFEDLQYTQELLTKILSTIKEDSELEFIYRASW